MQCRRGHHRDPPCLVHTKKFQSPPPACHFFMQLRMSRKTMRVCGVLLLLSAAARGLVSKAGSESSPTERLLQNLPLHDNSKGLTRPAGLFCRGGSAAAGRGPEAGGCRAKQSSGRGALPAVAGGERPSGVKQGWGQLRRSPEASASSLSTELAQRGTICTQQCCRYVCTHTSTAYIVVDA